MRIVELRSDTFTLPTEEMLEAIRHAKLGNDGYGEDPTVNRLEDMAAEMLGMEDALLVTSGTQGNLVSLLAQTSPGEEVILGRNSHIFLFEMGSMAFIAGLMAHIIDDSSGFLDPEDVEAAIRSDFELFPKTSLVCMENTHMMAGGIAVTPEQIKAVKDVVEAHNLRLYLDGARIFNAAVALGVDVKAFTRNVDSVMFCLSKGLCCPVGSLVVGDSDFIKRARRFRTMVGGTMRQAGIIAAAGIVALEKMIDRLREDHENARRLAEGLAKIDGLKIDLSKVQTNIVYVDISALNVDAERLVRMLKERGIKTTSLTKSSLRMVTHKDVSREDIDYVVETMEQLVEHIQEKSCSEG